MKLNKFISYLSEIPKMIAGQITLTPNGKIYTEEYGNRTIRNDLLARAFLKFDYEPKLKVKKIKRGKHEK